MASKYSPIFRYTVKGNSMEPHIKEGAKVYVSRLAYLFVDPEPEEIVVVNHPKEKFPIVKRIKEVTEEGHFIVEGDNSEHSTDSRDFGPIQRRHIIGRVMEI
ncbi:MAG: nickel-type superoxide dismutase maturation protease [Candidatus Spechtbacterales bacterium]